MKIYASNVVIRCAACHKWSGRIDETKGDHSQQKSESPSFFCCPKCGHMLAVLLDNAYALRSGAELVTMTVEALSDLDLAKLLFRQIEHQHLISGLRGKAYESKLLEAALWLVKYPKGFDLNSFSAQQLLSEKQRREKLRSEPKTV